MNLENQPSPDDILDRATSALRNTTVLNVPPAHCVSATIIAVNAHSVSPARLQSDQKWQRTIRAVRYGSLAAALMFLAATLGVVALWNHAATPAFGQVVESVKQARSVTFINKHRSEPKTGIVMTGESKDYLQGHFARSEDLGTKKNGDLMSASHPTTYIYDTQTGQVLCLDEQTKIAEKSKHSPTEWTSNFQNNPVVTFSGLAEKDAKFLGEESLNGKNVLVYSLIKLDIGIGYTIKEGETAKVWVDPETHLPVQLLVETWIDTGKVPPFLSRQLKTDFKWNEPLDPILFSMDVPEGFKVVDRTTEQETKPAK